MAGAIGPGDFVAAARTGKLGIVKLGDVFRCTGIERRPFPCGVCWRIHGGLHLDGLPMSPHRTGAWPTCCFRPIYRPKAELTESLLRKATEPSELEPA